MSPQTHFRENERLIAPSQGLLTTTHASHPAQKVLVLLPPNNIKQSDAATGGSHQHKPKHKDQSSSVLKGQLGLKAPDDPTPSPRHSQPKSDTWERSRVQGFSLLPPASPAQPPEPMQGLRLLHWQPVPRGETTFPKLPLPTSSWSPPKITVPMGEARMIKLLHIDAGRETVTLVSLLHWPA